MAKCKICKDNFKPISKQNTICSKEKCKKENHYLCIKKYMKSDKGKIAIRKATKKQYEKNYVRLIAENLINGVYVKKYSNGKTDVKITLYKKCSRDICNNTFYSIGNENIELGKFDKKYCSIKCSKRVSEKTKRKDLEILNPIKLRKIKDRENERRKYKKRVANMTKEQIEKKNERSKKYRQTENYKINRKKYSKSLKGKAQTQIQRLKRKERTRLTTPKISSELKKLTEFFKSKREYKNYNNLHADHIYALKGKNYSGLTNANNLQWLPSELNVKKSNMDFEDWQKVCKQNRKEYNFILNKHGLKFNRQYITIKI